MWSYSVMNVGHKETLQGNMRKNIFSIYVKNDYSYIVWLFSIKLNQSFYCRLTCNSHGP